MKRVTVRRDKPRVRRRFFALLASAIILAGVVSGLCVVPAAHADTMLSGVPTWNQNSLNTASLRATGCAVTSLAMICNYFGSGKDLQTSVNDFIAAGISDSSGYINTRSGLIAAVGGTAVNTGRVSPANLSAIRAQLDAGNPVEAWDAALPHHYVIVGYSGSTFYINDPATGTCRANPYTIDGYFTYSGTHSSWPPANGSFVQVSGSASIYVIAGGAPLYVSNWAAVGGSKPYAVISQAQFNSLPSVPADGTFVNARTASGAEAGSFVIAGGAPIYISSWSVYGGEPAGVVGIDAWDIQNITNPAAHLNAVPANGTFVKASDSATIYRIAGGAPLGVSNWAAVGGSKPYVTIDPWDLQNITNPAAHLYSVPANGTFVNAVTAAGAEAGSYVIAGGAPFYISTWSIYGGEPAGVVGIDAWDIQNITNPAAHLNAKPSDGTLVEGLPSKTYWSFAAGYRSPAAANSAAVPVDDVGLAAFPVVDTVAPVTTVAGVPSGWVNHAVTLTFVAKDNTGGSGVSYTEYAVNGGTWTHGTSVTVSTPGITTVSYCSADNAGNLEKAKSCQVRIDTAAPTARVRALSVTAAHATKGKVLKLRVTISDPAPSCGCASLRIVLTTAKGKKLITRTFKSEATDKALTLSDTLTRTLSKGSYYVCVRATDAAGNIQAKVYRAKFVVK